MSSQPNIVLPPRVAYQIKSRTSHIDKQTHMRSQTYCHCHTVGLHADECSRALQIPAYPLLQTKDSTLSCRIKQAKRNGFHRYWSGKKKQKNRKVYPRHSTSTHVCGPRCGEKKATVHHLDRNSSSSSFEWKRILKGRDACSSIPSDHTSKPDPKPHYLGYTNHQYKHG